MLNTYKYNKYVVTGTLPYDYQLTELGQFETIWGNLQIVLQANLPYRACRRGQCAKPHPKGHVLQCTPFHSAYIKG